MRVCRAMSRWPRPAQAPAPPAPSAAVRAAAQPAIASAAALAADAGVAHTMGDSFAEALQQQCLERRPDRTAVGGRLVVLRRRRSARRFSSVVRAQAVTIHAQTH